MVRQTSVNLTEATKDQVGALKSLGFGTFTDIVRLAVDRMARQETELAARRNSRIVDAILALRDEVDAGWGGSVTVSDGAIDIDTRASRDPRRSRNGGEYYEWLHLFRGNTGTVYAQDCTSCELAQRDEPEVIGNDWQAVLTTVLDLARQYGVPLPDVPDENTGKESEPNGDAGDADWEPTAVTQFCDCGETWTGDKNSNCPSCGEPA